VEVVRKVRNGRMAAARRSWQSVADRLHRLVAGHAHHAHVRVRVPVGEVLRLEVERPGRRRRVDLPEAAEAGGVGHRPAVVEPVVVLHLDRHWGTGESVRKLG